MKNIYREEIVILEILDEMNSAVEKHGDFNSLHEAYAVIKEEIDELWEEIKLKRELRVPERMRNEAIQVAAMCLKLIKYLDEGKI